jgi:hypothetical protein
MSYNNADSVEKRVKMLKLNIKAAGVRGIASEQIVNFIPSLKIHLRFLLNIFLIMLQIF